MKLKYWYAECFDDSDLYSIRAKTKKSALAYKEEFGADRFGQVFKVEVEYEDAFELLTMCMGEGRGFWEVPPASLDKSQK